MKIGIMICDRLSKVCSATGCFKAFSNKSAAFENYKSRDEIGSLFQCTGCETELTVGLTHQMNQMKRNNIETIHLAQCIVIECDRINEISDFLSNQTFDVIIGTHG